MRNRFLRNREGSTFLIVALSALSIVGGVGVAVDIGRSQMVQAKLQNAVDAAALAAGASVSTEDLDGLASKYVNLNFSRNNLGATLNDVDATLSEDRKIVTVTASATLPTTLTKVFKRTAVNIDATSEVTRSNKGLELALVLDTTGSMTVDGKIEALKDASHAMIDILFGDDETAENLWVGLVPFSHSVNIGPARTNWLNAAHYAGQGWPEGKWAGCVEARYAGGRDEADDPPYDLANPEANPASPYERFKAFAMPYVTKEGYNPPPSSSTTVQICSGSSSQCNCTNYSCGYEYPSMTVVYFTRCGHHKPTNKHVCTKQTTNITITSTTGPNSYCPSAITPLTNVKATLESGIDALIAGGWTHINYGAVWGWRLISPRWRGYWGGDMNTNNLPLDYNAPLMSKAVVIMTDGLNTVNPTGYSAYPSASGIDEADMDAKLTSVCNALKANDVTVYTVLFVEDDEHVKTLLRDCATTPDHFFDSPTNDSLQSAFQTIGDSLANLRISQ